MKKFYKENRVFVILMGITLVCIAIILGMACSYIISSNSGNVYGNRLDGISDVEITKKKITEMQKSLNEEEKIQDVTINIHGKIVYFNVEFTSDTSIDDAKNVAIKCLDFFEETYLNFYDLQFLFTKDEVKEESSSEEEDENKEPYFPIIGYRKAGVSTITWSNNAK